MRYLALSLAIFILAATACKKDANEDKQRQPVIRGKVIDIVTQKPVPGVQIMVVDFWTDGWNYSVPVTGNNTSDQEGNFEVWYTLKDPRDSRILKLANIPLVYQRGARINGADEGCVFYDLDNDPGEIFGGYRVSDEEIYTIALMPLTYVYILPPTIPTAWANDTIEITSWSFCMPESENIYCWNNWCNVYTDVITFPVSDSNTWKALSAPLPLRLGNKIRLQYKIFNKGVQKQYKHLELEGNFGDTTAIMLPF